MPATLQKLIKKARSQLAEELRCYYRRLIHSLDRTPWYRNGQSIPASAVAIPIRVLKEETRRPERLWDRDDDREDEARNEPARRYVDPELAALYEEPTFVKRRQEVAWKDERPNIKRAVVLGAPGGGKSFLTLTTAMELAWEARRALAAWRQPLEALYLPVSLRLVDLARPDLSRDPAEAIMQLLRDQYQLSARFEAWIRTRLTTDRCWLVLDALDEVDHAHHPSLEDRLRAIETQGWQSHVVLTCRTMNYDRGKVPWHTLSEYELAPFGPQELHAFVGRWFNAGSLKGKGEALQRVLDRNFALSHAAHNPLRATLTCLPHEEAPVTETTRRVDLYARVLRGLARQAWKKNPLHPTDPHVDDVLRLLIPVARRLFERSPGGNLFANSALITAIRTVPDWPLPLVLFRKLSEPGGFNADALAYAPDLWREELRYCGILVDAGLSKDGEAQFSFLHRTFLEYLTAWDLAKQAENEGWPMITALADQKAWMPEWQEVIVLLAGQLRGPRPLLEMLSDPKPTNTNRWGDDYFRHRLAVAAQCLPEIPSEIRTRESEIVDRITTAAFSLWWEWKINGMEEVVPHFTCVLPTLGQVNGRMEGVPLLAWLSQRLSEVDMEVRRRAAAEAVGELGAVATPAILGRLSERLGDRNWWVRRAAVEAVGRLMAQRVRIFEVESGKWEARTVDVLAGES